MIPIANRRLTDRLIVRANRRVFLLAVVGGGDGERLSQHPMTRTDLYRAATGKTRAQKLQKFRRRQAVDAMTYPKQQPFFGRGLRKLAGIANQKLTLGIQQKVREVSRLLDRGRRLRWRCSCRDCQ